MKTNIMLALLSAIIGGAIGGAISRRADTHAERQPSAVITANRFVLVDGSGRAVGYWGLDNHNETVLTFNSAMHISATAETESKKFGRGTATIGVDVAGQPFVSLAGRDLEKRASLFLNEYDKPRLTLGDAGRTRITLGIVDYDAPSALDDTWILGFRNPDRAAFGVTPDRAGKVKATLYAFDAEGKEWNFPR